MLTPINVVTICQHTKSLLYYWWLITPYVVLADPRLDYKWNFVSPKTEFLVFPLYLFLGLSSFTIIICAAICLIIHNKTLVFHLCSPSFLTWTWSFIGKSLWLYLKHLSWNKTLFSSSLLHPPTSSSTRTIVIVSNLATTPTSDSQQPFSSQRPAWPTWNRNKNICLLWTLPISLAQPEPPGSCPSTISLCSLRAHLSLESSYSCICWFAACFPPIFLLEHMHNINALRVGALPVLFIIFLVLTTLLGT